MKTEKLFIYYIIISNLFLHVFTEMTIKKLYKEKFKKNDIYEKFKRYPFFIFLTGFTFSVIKELNPTLVHTEIITMKEIQCMIKFIEKFWSNMINNRPNKYLRNEILQAYQSLNLHKHRTALLTNLNTYVTLSKKLVKITALLWKKPLMKALVEVVKCSCNSTGNILMKTFSLAQLYSEKNFTIFFTVNFFEIPKLLYKMVSTVYSIYKTIYEKEPTAKWNLLGKTTGKVIVLVYKVMRIL